MRFVQNFSSGVLLLRESHLRRFLRRFMTCTWPRTVISRQANKKTLWKKPSIETQLTARMTAS